MIDERFVILAFLLNILGTSSYLYAVIKGHAKPNQVTWFLWALAPLIGFAAQISQGVGISSLMTFGIGFGPLLVLLASFLNKNAKWKLSRFDFLCGSVSLLAIVLWLLTQDAMIALTLSLTADLVACFPTLIKSWYFPETGEYKAYLFAAASAFITTLSLPVWTFSYYAFPLWTLIICLIFVALIKFRIGKLLLQ